MLRHMFDIMFDIMFDFFKTDLPTDIHFQSYMLRCYAKAKRINGFVWSGMIFYGYGFFKEPFTSFMVCMVFYGLVWTCTVIHSFSGPLC